MRSPKLNMPARTLICHPATLCDAVGGMRIAARRVQETTLILSYRFDGPTALLRLPEPSSPERADGLWRHICCEAFLQAPGVPGYYEFNFSPSSEWAVYRFDAYREGMKAVPIRRPPAIDARREDHELELVAAVDLADLVDTLERATLVLAVAAVIETVDGRLSYWALRHPNGPPDFHHPEGFALALPPSPRARSLP